MLVVVRPQSLRERAEEFERASLSPAAMLSAETKGRDRYEEADALRTAFQLDAHRILQAAAFRRLGGKSAHVGAAGSTALVLTLEAARLADSLSRALRLNADLARAVALGHALGTAPFGDAGTPALSDFGYEPGEQAVRVVERLERDGAGLNLTWETRDGMLTVRGARPPATAEGQVARLVVRIAEATFGPLPASRPVADARDQLGSDERAWGDRLVEDAARASADRAEVRLSDSGERILQGLASAAAEARRADRGIQEQDHRAVHCLQSLAIYALEHGRSRGGAATRQRIIDELVAKTDREIIAAYRARFEPTT
jgi:dGTPase